MNLPHLGFNLNDLTQHAASLISQASKFSKDLSFGSFGSSTLVWVLAFFFLFPILRMFLNPILLLTGSVLNSFAVISASIIQLVTEILVALINVTRSTVRQSSLFLQRPTTIIAVVSVGLLAYLSSYYSSKKWTPYLTAIGSGLALKAAQAILQRVRRGRPDRYERRYLTVAPERREVTFSPDRHSGLHVGQQDGVPAQRGQRLGYGHYGYPQWPY